MALQPPDNIFQRIRRISARMFPPKSVGRDFTGVTQPSSEIPDLKATVVSVKPVSAKNDHVMVNLKVPPVLLRQFVRPGQFCRIAKQGAKSSCLVCIASPPGSETFELLFLRGADPCAFTRLKVGAKIAISHVMGDGLAYEHLRQSTGDLFAFIDSAQGFAAVKSLIEWPEFRAITGEGANRINHVTIYYAGGKSAPHSDCFSAWSVYAVNVIPLTGSIMEYLSTKAAVGRPKKNLAADFAIAAVSSLDTFEALFSTLVLLGFRRSSIQRFSSEDLLLQTMDFDEAPQENPEVVCDGFEQEVWQNWVHVREQMRTEFERKWAQKARQDRDMKQRRAEKVQAWASWFQTNQDEWTEEQWDNEPWGQYWQSWKTNRQQWAGDEAWKQDQSWRTWNQTGGKSQSKSWNQQNSQEYWDWVGKGSSKGPSSAAGGGGRSGSTYSDFNDYTNGGGTWGNANNNTEWQRGYKYQYQEPKKDTKSNNGHKGSSSSQSGWKGWNRDYTKRTSSSSSSSSSGRSSGSSKFNFGTELDFYSVLGIDSGASRTEIKKAYRKKAMKHHPDLNPENLEEAHTRMKEIVVAWTVLKDDEKRKKYDAFGSDGFRF